MNIKIEADDGLVRQALKLTGFKTPEAVVEEALKLFIQIRQQTALRELRGKLKWEGDLEQMRFDNLNKP